MTVATAYIIGLLYSVYTFIYHPIEPGLDATPGLIIGGCWISLYAMEILVINHICDKTSAEVRIYLYHFCMWSRQLSNSIKHKVEFYSARFSQ